MIDLQANSGLPLHFDELNEKFRYGEGIIFDKLNKVPLTSMLPGLLNKSLRYPETVYLEHQNIRHKNDDQFFKDTSLHYDVVMLPSGLMGVEFIRSHIFYAELESAETEPIGVSEIVECLSGMVTILLQRNVPKGEWDFETRVSEGLVVRLKEGEKFIIPRGYYYTFINTRVRPVVFSRFYSKECVCDYSKFRYEQGLAYFAIRKNAKQEIVLNPRYREIPQVQKVTSELQICTKAPQLTADPLYVQIKNRDEFFSLF
jgi:oxalate decarboxylase/phosphoglucose isomerase-like protein (cupin superfamily)